MIKDMKNLACNLSVLYIMIFASFSFVAIIEELLTVEARADNANIVVQNGQTTYSFNRNNANLYVSNVHDNTLQIISGNTKTVIANTPYASKPSSLSAFHSSFKMGKYVINAYHQTLTIISGNTKTVIANPYVGKTILAPLYAPHRTYSREVPPIHVTPRNSSNVAAPGASLAHGIVKNSARSHPPMIP